MTTSHRDHGEHQHHHDRAFRSEGGIDVLELEGEALSGFTGAAVEVVGPLLTARGVTVERIVDLGCGPGVATCVLAELFEHAVVVAADSSDPMLARAAGRADRLGRSAQVEQHHVDLNGDLSSLGVCQLVHASMVLHHVRDEVTTLAHIRSLVSSGGLVCLLERADPLRVELAEECGLPGLWDRLDDAWRRWFQGPGRELPGAAGALDHPVMLAAAGFDVVEDETLELRVELGEDPSAARFVALQLQRAASVLVDHADPDDLRPLAAIAQSIVEDPEGGWRGAIHASRRLIIAAPR